MDAALRALVMYTVLLVVFRFAGKRTLSEITPFDLLLLLIISETTQRALVVDNQSFTHSAILILTFVLIDIGLSLLKQHSDTAARVLEGTPVVLIADGITNQRAMNMERVGEDDILETARAVHGLESLDQIKFAILERTGKISIIPK
jgi:uncharacterized membrane protein YcaP (DUF421 family)